LTSVAVATVMEVVVVLVVYTVSKKHPRHFWL